MMTAGALSGDGALNKQKEGRRASRWGDLRLTGSEGLLICDVGGFTTAAGALTWHAGVSRTAHLTQNTEITEARILSLWYLVLIWGLAGLLMRGFRKSGCSVGAMLGRNYPQRVVVFQNVITGQAAVERRQTCNHTQSDCMCLNHLGCTRLKNILHAIFEKTAF